MPRVPSYNGPQVRSTSLEGGFQQGIEVTQARQLGASLANVSEGADRIGLRDDSQAAFDAEARLKADWLQTDADLRKRYRGANVDGYQAEADKFWADAPGKYGEALSPRAKQIASRSLTAARLQASGSALSYINTEKERAQDESFVAAKSVEIQTALTDGRPEAIGAAREQLRQKNAMQGALKGWSAEQLQAANTHDTSVLHVGALTKLMQTDPAAAKLYFEANRGEMTAEAQASVSTKIETVTAAADGEKTAGDVWQRLGPKGDGQPVELDKMEAAARDAYPNDPTRQKAAIADLRERATAFNSAEKERTASNTNAVMLAQSKGAGLQQLTRMPEFLALPGAEQAKIRQHVEDRQYALMLRANASDARSEAAAARAERELERKSFGAYLEYSDPANLATMTRDQVQALVPVLGRQNTAHLVTRWDGLQKADGKLAATIDKQDFDHVADQFGFKPFAKKTDEEKAALGELQYRVEQLIDTAQQAKKAPLTRQEKNELMRGELARTVTVDPGWFSSNRETPVLALKPDEIARVVVPQADRSQIVDALKAAYQRNPSNPLYAPTEDNVRRLFLRKTSRAADLLTAPNGQ